MKKAILTLLLTLFTITSALAIMPPEVYKKAIKNSKVKALAIVTKVENLDSYNNVQEKRVYFKTIKAYTKATPQEFTGYCDSVKDSNKFIPVGGTIYYYPHKNDLVLVSVTNTIGGSITSYSRITKEEKEILLKKKLKHIDIYPLGFKIK